MPLLVLRVFNALYTYSTALKYVNDKFDSALINSADSVAARIRATDNGIKLEIPAAVHNVLGHNGKDSFYYQVQTQDGKPLLGNTSISSNCRPKSEYEWKFEDGSINNEKVRIVSVLFPQEGSKTDYLIVQVAQTLRERQKFVHEILESLIIHDLILIISIIIIVYYGVARGLYPLKELEAALFKKSLFNLKPIPENIAPSEVEPLIDAINNLLIRLKNEVSVQRRFLSNAAHQMKTPLSGLKTYSGLLKRINPNLESTAIIEQLEIGINRMTHLVNKLLSLAKLESDKAMTLINEPVDLNSTIAEAIAETAGVAEKKNIEINFPGLGIPVFVNGNAAALYEMVINLIENAIIYTQPGGKVKIIANATADNSVLLTVQDNGPGIPVEERERVFERFYRILGTDTPGSGLGLAIVKEIAALHNAAITVRSGADNIGTIFSIEFKPLTTS